MVEAHPSCPLPQIFTSYSDPSVHWPCWGLRVSYWLPRACKLTPSLCGLHGWRRNVQMPYSALPWGLPPSLGVSPAQNGLQLLSCRRSFYGQELPLTDPTSTPNSYIWDLYFFVDQKLIYKAPGNGLIFTLALELSLLLLGKVWQSGGGRKTGLTVTNLNRVPIPPSAARVCTDVQNPSNWAWI